MIKGPSSNFIQFFKQYKAEQSIPKMNLCIHGRNLSNDFLNTTDIDDEDVFNTYYNKLIKIGGLHSYVKIFNPSDLYSKASILNKYNILNYFSIAEQKKLLKKVGNKINLNKEFFISLDEGTANEIIFGTKARGGYLLDIDYFGSPSHSRSIYKTYEVDKDRMIVNVDAITVSQQQRKNLGTDIGFHVINNPGNYVSSLGLSGISIELLRRNEIGGNITIL